MATPEEVSNFDGETANDLVFGVNEQPGAVGRLDVLG
jgi:hypothetical protein